MTRARPRPLGPFGLWTFSLDRQPWSRSKELAAEIEEMGWSAIWIPEATNRNVFVNATLLLTATQRLAVVTGIAPIHNRDAMATVNGQRTLDEAFPDRFVLGLGVSHAWLVEDLRGGTYSKPLPTMSAYLDRMDAAPFSAHPPTARDRRLLAALGPKMLALAADKADGAHPYLVTPDHTALARPILGPGKILAPDQKVLIETDPSEARRISRVHLSGYLGQPNYRNSFIRQGFEVDDLDGGGSDRLVDAIVAWGSIETVVARVRAHRDAGADHVAVQVLPRDMGDLPLEQWRAVASALMS
ncbi:MAG: LLM class F420-dependent oxidoreductase [Actinobacteria bacterium]|jgi:probable F420-dependent oxidoreductase|nr:MAG: LLM class F420-dependent oxidoreductase [Actinomycetota bacterium]